MSKYLLIGLAILLFGLGFFSANGIDYFRTKDYKKKLETIEAEKRTLTDQQEALKQQYKEAEEKAALKEQEASQLHSLISANDKGLAVQADKISAASKNYENEIKNITTDISNIDRCARLCKSRAELGFPCSPQFCDKYK